MCIIYTDCSLPRVKELVFFVLSTDEMFYALKFNDTFWYGKLFITYERLIIISGANDYLMSDFSSVYFAGDARLQPKLI